MRRTIKLGLIEIAVMLGALIAYEAYAVCRAFDRTPAIIAAQRNRPVTLAQIGERRLAMLLKVEDSGFYQHRGVDFSTPG